MPLPLLMIIFRFHNNGNTFHKDFLWGHYVDSNAVDSSKQYLPLEKCTTAHLSSWVIKRSLFYDYLLYIGDNCHTDIVKLFIFKRLLIKPLSLLMAGCVDMSVHVMQCVNTRHYEMASVTTLGPSNYTPCQPKVLASNGQLVSGSTRLIV